MQSTESALSEAAVQALLLAVQPEAPGTETSARIMHRVRARLDESASIVTVRRDAGWKPMFPGAEQKILFDDGVTQSWLMRLEPGVVLPKHEHDQGPEECLVLEGEMWFNGESYGPGDYMVALPGSTHHETLTRTGAMMFLRTRSPRADQRAS